MATAPGATSAPSARYEIAPEFQRAMIGYWAGISNVYKYNYLGSPVEPARTTKLAEQSFGVYDNPGCHSEDSLLVWREDTLEIYLLIVENTGLHIEECRDFWRVYPDTWKPGDPNNEDLEAPPGRVAPTGGFGKVWRENFYGKPYWEDLGFATAPERYVVGTVQRFENGTAFYFPDTKAVYVLFPSFEFQTRSGLRTAQIWFRPG